MNKMKHKLTIVVLYMIISSCNNTDSNEFAFSNYSWECPKEGGKEIFTSNKEEWEIDQLILDGIIICSKNLCPANALDPIVTTLSGISNSVAVTVGG